MQRPRRSLRCLCVLVTYLLCLFSTDTTCTVMVYRAGASNTEHPARRSVAHEFRHCIYPSTVRGLSGVPRTGQDLRCRSLASVRHLYVLLLVYMIFCI